VALDLVLVAREDALGRVEERVVNIFAIDDSFGFYQERLDVVRPESLETIKTFAVPATKTNLT